MYTTSECRLGGGCLAAVGDHANRVYAFEHLQVGPIYGCTLHHTNECVAPSTATSGGMLPDCLCTSVGKEADL